MAENNPFPGENNTGHIWDDDIRELDNPPPNWWMIAFWLSLLWWIGYTVLYPSWPVGQKPTQGVLGWSQIQEYEQGLGQVEAVRAPFEEKITGMSAKEILEDPGLTQYTLASAKVIFGDNCAACHGSGGQGNPGFPVLADDDWLWGGSVEKITETITMGRKGAMTAHAEILSDAEIDALAKFVVELSEGAKGSDEGWALFQGKGCIACHGPKANGVIAELPDGTKMTVGAANLTDGIWRFQPGGYESVKHTISYGVNQAGVEQTRDAVMPVFGPNAELGGRAKLTDQQIKKLAVYVHQFGGGE